MSRRNPYARLGFAVVALLLSQSPGLARASADPRPPEDMEEVQIIAARLKLGELRAEIVKTEDDFFAHLNELMADPEMHVICRTGPAKGSHIHKRVCEPQFVETANANYIRDLMQNLASASLSVSGSAFGSIVQPVPPGIAISGNELTFRSKVVSLLKDDAALRDLAYRRESLEVLYKAAQKARFKDGRIFARD